MENEVENITHIKMLPNDRIVFVKKINLENTRISGVLCYARKPYDGYSMRPKKKTQLEHNMFGYQEDEYPSDVLDMKILDGVKKQFPNAICQTSILMFDKEVERNQFWMSQLNKEVFKLIIEYVPSVYPYIGAGAEGRNMEAYYIPLSEERLNRINTNLIIQTENRSEYEQCVGLLKNTYELFSLVNK